MKTTWIITTREVREKGRLFVVAAALAIVPFLASLLPGARSNAALTIAMTGGFLAAVLGIGIATTLGASTIARDLAERRMSFYFTKPLGAPAIWFGKALASLFISLACAAIIVFPAFLASRRQWAMHWLGDVQPLLVLAATIVVAFFLAHLLSSVIRSRSPLLALDFLFLCGSLAALYLILHPLFLGGASELISRMLSAIVGATLITMVIAPVWQLANGRSDIRRSHAALMRFLWPAIGVVLLIAGGIVAWVVHVSPGEVVVSSLEQAPRGPSVIVTGTAKGRLDYRSTFLIDRTTGRFTRIASPMWWGSHFSDDGRVAAWLQPEGLLRLRGLELHTSNGNTGLMLSPSSELVLSSDGARVAITKSGLLIVHDVATRAILASGAGLDGRARHQLFFVTPDLVRVYEHAHRHQAATPLRIFELDVRARTMRKTGELLVRAPRQPVSATRDGSRIFIRGANVIADGRTGATVAAIAGNVVHSAMLNGGRLAVVTHDGTVPQLRTFEPDGTPRHTVSFPNIRSIWIAAETEDGKLILAGHGKTMIVVDHATGVVEKTVSGVRGPMPRWSADPRLVRFAADQQLAGVDANGKLLYWSPEAAPPR